MVTNNHTTTNRAPASRVETAEKLIESLTHMDLLTQRFRDALAVRIEQRDEQVRQQARREALSECLKIAESEHWAGRVAMRIRALEATTPSTAAPSDDDQGVPG